MSSRRRTTVLLTLLTLTAFTSTELFAQRALSNKNKGAATKTPTRTKKKPNATAVTKADRDAQTAQRHKTFVKPLLTAWNGVLSNDIRSYDNTTTLTHIGPCTLAIWNGKNGDAKDYSLVDLRKVDMFDKPSTNRGNDGYTSYRFDAEFKCKGNTQCIKGDKDPSKTRSSIQSGIYHTRLVGNGRTQYSGTANTQQKFYDLYLLGLRAVAGCQRKTPPTVYNGQPG